MELRNLRIRNLSPEALIGIVVFVLLLFLIVGPVFMIFYGSFVSRRGQTAGFTIENFGLLLEPKTVETMGNTFIIAGLSTLFGFLLGFPLAFLVARADLPWSKFFESISAVPLYLNPLAGTIGWILLFSPQIGLVNRIVPLFNVYSVPFIGFIMGVYYSPYFFLFCTGALTAMDPELEEASRVAGANDRSTVWRVTLPLIFPAVMSAAILVFVLSSSMFSIPLLLGYSVGTLTIPTKIFQFLAFPPANYSGATVLSLVLLVIVFALTFLLRMRLNPKRFVTIGGKGYRPRKLSIGFWRYPAFVIALLMQFGLILLPVIMVIITSFSQNYSTFVFTLSNYLDIFFGIWSTLFWRSLQNSLIISLVGATLTMLLAGLISYISVRTRLKGRGVLDYIASLSLSVPGVVMAVGLIWFWLGIPIPVYGTIWILILACMGHFMSYGVRSISSSLVQVSVELEECGKVCGASFFQNVKDIIVPLVKPGFFSGWVLLFAVFFREAAMVVLLYTYETITLSVLLIDMFDNVVFTIFCAIGIIQMLVIWVTVLVFRKVFGVSVRMAEV